MSRLALTGGNAGQHREAAVDMGDGIEMKLLGRNSFDDVLPQHQIVDILRRDNVSLLPGQSLQATYFKKPGNFLIDRTHGLEFPFLVHRARDRNALRHWQSCQARQ